MDSLQRLIPAPLGRVARRIIKDWPSPVVEFGPRSDLYKTDLTLAEAYPNPYDRNLVSAEVPWGSALSYERVPFVPGDGLVSRGPFRIDINHRETALIVGPLYTMLNGRENDTPAMHPPLGRTDLRGKTIRLNMRFDYETGSDPIDLLAHGRPVYWFQSSLSRRVCAGGPFDVPPRIVNYFHNFDLTDAAIAGETVQIPLRDDLNDWTALGRNPCDMRPIIGSAAKYTACVNRSEFSEALSSPINTGLLFLLPPSHPDGSVVHWLSAPNAHPLPEIMHGAMFRLREFCILRA